MTDRWLIRIHAQWFPAGMRFVVRVGLAEGPAEDALWLTTDGWKPLHANTKDFPWREVMAHVGLRDFDLTHLCAHHFEDVARIIVRQHVERLMYEPRAWEGVEVDEVVMHDPKASSPVAVRT